jgi:ABC-type glycerol-3-phosphate transport system substrate-binding protein
MSKFQIILLSVFGVAIIGAVLVFSLARGSSSANAKIVIWGPFSVSDFNSFSQASGLQNSKTVSVSYVQENPTTFDADFTEALAEGRGPDLVIISQDQTWQERNKLILIPYTNVSQNDFTTTFIGEASLFAGSTGIYALPLVLDPMVLYTNSDLLNAAAIAEPPKYWDEIYTYANKLTQKDGAGNITQSTIALGGTTNIPHAKDILSLLMLQAGTAIADIQNGVLVSELQNSYNLPESPATSALDFYTQFSNPEKPFYSWNPALQTAQTNFISGNSAFYLGYASELTELKAKNPNLTIGVSAVPQSRVSGKVVTFGTLYGIALAKSAANPTAALTTALSLVSSASDSILAQTLSLAPARRDLLSQPAPDGISQVSYDAALQAKAWIDPNPAETTTLFDNMIDSVNSGRARTDEAISTADGELNTLTN